MYKMAGLCLLVAGAALAQKYGVGHTPTAEEVKAWDISIPPDGAGLPDGSGTVAQGKDFYASKCAKCHGSQGQGGDEGPLAGGQGSLRTAKPLKTVGSYWPYATTLYDYISRAMPFKQPGTLSPNQVYALVAHILHLNGIIGENEVMDARTLPKVKMPNRDGFIRDTRPDTGKARSKK
ncbi:MAG TPA: cytochrome c [Bryobacteraceae bacterium]|jgi:cytochrome c|nr:cytochrome c [Bryobacteraceae bacterium]